MKTRLLACCLACSTSYAALAQQPYDKDVLQNAVKSSAGYQKRTKDDRYEGLYSLQVGAPLLDVISVTLGEISYELADDKKLFIKASKTQPYKVIGVSGSSFGLSKNYRLDAVVNSDGQKVIPIKEVLSPNSIYPKSLGVFGYIGQPQYPTMYVPVRVSDKPAAGATRDIRILLLPGATVDKFTWQFARSQQGQCAAFTKGDPPQGGNARFPAQKPIAVTLDAAAGLQPGDEVCINISYKVVGDTDWRTKSLKVLVTN